ncbi:MAG: fmt, methionyl-tRNA formyltransferase [Candidatus Saccharibacteria bacterium]|nr:fmt, methionyl-tRNA formyltransferase [Candidatus Saccharibacteria bacterium]
MADSVVFFGSGPVAAKALALLAQHSTIEAVITKPQPEHHKEVFPVIATSRDLGITNVLTVSNKRELADLFADQKFTSRVGVVIDFGIIITQDVIDSFELGIVNSHFSLLPKWRGADPITFSVLKGDSETGVSLMLIVEKLDEGPVLVQQALPLTADVTTPVLTDQLIQLSDDLLKATLPLYLASSIEPQPQPETGATYSSKLSKEDGTIDWQKSAIDIERQIRAFIEWPKSRTTIGGRDVVITAAHVESGTGTPGVIWLQDRQLGMQTGEGILVIDQLIPAGKKPMSGSDFLLGYKPTV